MIDKKAIELIRDTMGIDVMIKMIDDKIARLQAARAEWVQAKDGSGEEGPMQKAPCSGKKKTESVNPPLKRLAEVRRFATQADIVQILEHSDGPLSEFHIKEQLDKLLNVKPSDSTLKTVLNAVSWRKGAKRYRLVDGKYELYDAEEDEDSDA